MFFTVKSIKTLSRTCCLLNYVLRKQQADAYYSRIQLSIETVNRKLERTLNDSCKMNVNSEGKQRSLKQEQVKINMI